MTLLVLLLSLSKADFAAPVPTRRPGRPVLFEPTAGKLYLTAAARSEIGHAGTPPGPGACILYRSCSGCGEKGPKRNQR